MTTYTRCTSQFWAWFATVRGVCPLPPREYGTWFKKSKDFKNFKWSMWWTLLVKQRNNALFWWNGHQGLSQSTKGTGADIVSIFQNPLNMNIQLMSSSSKISDLKQGYGILSINYHEPLHASVRGPLGLSKSSHLVIPSPTEKSLKMTLTSKPLRLGHTMHRV